MKSYNLFRSLVLVVLSFCCTYADFYELMNLFKAANSSLPRNDYEQQALKLLKYWNFPNAPNQFVGNNTHREYLRSINDHRKGILCVTIIRWNTVDRNLFANNIIYSTSYCKAWSAIVYQSNMKNAQDIYDEIMDIVTPQLIRMSITKVPTVKIVIAPPKKHSIPIFQQICDTYVKTHLSHLFPQNAPPLDGLIHPCDMMHTEKKELSIYFRRLYSKGAIFTLLLNELAQYEYFWLLDSDLQLKNFPFCKFWQVHQCAFPMTPIVSQPLITPNTQYYPYLNRAYWDDFLHARKRNISSVDTQITTIVTTTTVTRSTTRDEFTYVNGTIRTHSVNTTTTIHQGEEKVGEEEVGEEVAEEVKIQVKQHTQIRYNETRSSYHTLLAAEVGFVEIQAPFMSTNYLEYFIISFLLPTLPMLQILGGSWGIDHLFCPVAEYYTSAMYTQSSMTTDTLSTTRKPPNLPCAVIIDSVAMEHVNTKSIRTNAAEYFRLVNEQVTTLMAKTFPVISALNEVDRNINPPDEPGGKFHLVDAYAYRLVVNEEYPRATKGFGEAKPVQRVEGGFACPKTCRKMSSTGMTGGAGDMSGGMSGGGGSSGVEQWMKAKKWAQLEHTLSFDP